MLCQRGHWVTNAPSYHTFILNFDDFSLLSTSFNKTICGYAHSDESKNIAHNKANVVELSVTVPFIYCVHWSAAGAFSIGKRMQSSHKESAVKHYLWHSSFKVKCF